MHEGMSVEPDIIFHTIPDSSWEEVEIYWAPHQKQALKDKRAFERSASLLQSR